ncbi:RdlA protein [Streptomyces sp. SCA3-4]|uniref:rodlin n=1 Tax=Streptomyces sichuanensis TaxID=2871810 RepID=UPI001CE31BC2|nr:rodlin [Streptomyces sichuanensis]MCA6095197.1 RdlA protein [Streptomyces sichuanensis]
MLKKVFATAALTASAVGCIASPAAASVNDERNTANGNDALTSYGRTETGGTESPQLSALQGSLDKLCIGVGKAGVQALLLANIGLQDIPVLTSQQQQQCTDNSTINDGDDPLSHLLDEIAVASGNGSGNTDGPH